MSVLAVTAVAAIGVVVVLVSAKDKIESCVEQAQPDAGAEARQSPPPPPSLSDEEKRRIAAIAQADPRLPALVPLSLRSSAEVPSDEVEPWTDYGLRVIGGAATVRLRQPSMLEGEWLALSHPKNLAGTSMPFTSVRYEATFKDVTSVHVLVDLTTERVMRISPHRGTLVGEADFLDSPPCKTDYD